MTDRDAIHRIIASAIDEARRAGLDYVGQTQKAIEQVRAVEPDLTTAEIMSAIDRAQRH